MKHSGFPSLLEIKPFTIQRHMASPVHYPIMVIGGAEDKVDGKSILATFFESAGGKDAKIGIIPCASQEPSVVGDRYHQIFREMGAPQVRVLDMRLPLECDRDTWLDILNDCTGVFVTGGDQQRLCDLIGGSRFTAKLKEAMKLGQLVLAGTSAGAAMMGERMIAAGSSGESPNRSLVDLAEGLGIIPEILVDQHFHNRNRMARLMSAIAAHPDKLGLGIDEDTCAAFEDDHTFQVLGKGTITVIDPGELIHNSYRHATETTPLSLHKLTLHVLSRGDRYNYRSREVLGYG
jgi:cyanophycinase